MSAPSRARRLASAFASTAALALAAGPALGQEVRVGPDEQGPTVAEAPAEPAEATGLAEDSAVEEARAHFEQGLRLVRREHWAAALSEFETSLQAHPSWSSLYNRALCLRNLHRYAEAIASLEELLETFGAELEVARRRDAETLLGDLRGLVTPVVIRVSAEGATLYVDDDEVGTSPLPGPLLLPSGPHQLEARLPGFLSERRRFVVVSGREQVVELHLSERPRLGSVRVFANVDGATVLLDGDEVGATPFRSAVQAGRHVIEVRSEGYRDGSQEVLVEAEDEITVSLTLDRRILLHPAWFWSTAGLALASALAVAGLGAAVHLLDAEYDPAASDAIDGYSQGRALMVGADVALAISCASAASALVLAFFTDLRR